MRIILVDAVDTLVIEGQGIFKEMHDLLETYPNRKIVLTNANDGEAKEFGLDAVPYEIFTLKHKPNKTDPAFFTKMLEHFGLNKDDVIYFEHNPQAVESAESIGLKSYHYDSQKKDLEGLKKFIDSNI